MAATAVYVRIAGIPVGGKTPPDAGKSFSNISATTSGFTLVGGGFYAMSVKGSTFGTVTLQMLGADDTTWVNVTQRIGSAANVEVYKEAFAADGYGLCYLPAGTYRVAIA